MHSNFLTRREFGRRLTLWGAAGCAAPATGPLGAGAPTGNQPPEAVLGFPGPWAFQWPKGALILVSDQQLQDLQDPDHEVDVSLTGTPRRITLRRFCQEQQALGVRTVILAFDHFFAQYRRGQGDQPRQLLPDTDAYIQHVAKISETLKAYGLGFELSLLSPLELGTGYRQRTGEQGRWVQYREGLRDPRTGRYEVQLWEHRRWTNNKGSIDVQRTGVRAFAFRERRIPGTPYHVVAPAEIIPLREPPEVEVWEGAEATAGNSWAARRITVRGRGETGIGPLDRVLVVVAYATPEMDYFSLAAAPFLQDLVRRYHAAGVPLHGLYSDEMHIQQDWAYHGHHDEGQFTLRYLNSSLAVAFLGRYGPEFIDFERFLVYFCYGQHGFLSTLESRLPAQHVLGETPDDIQRTFLLRRRYYELLSSTVVGLFARAKEHAEELYGHALEARAHVTWAQSPTIDAWDTGPTPMAPRQYEYTPNFLWANTVHQAASACDDYFRWNDFLTGGGNDHTEGGWLDRNYYALALACSTGILNRVPYAYAAHWGMPAAVSERRQALVDAYGAAASPPFQAVEDSEHRDIEVLMLYPISLVACEERFGSWMVQYGYANYVTADQLLARGRVTEDGRLEMAGRHFRTVVALFEPLPPSGLLQLLEDFVARGGRVIWSGPPPRLAFDGTAVLERWQKLFGVRGIRFAHQGLPAPGEDIRFGGILQRVVPQTILTHFLVDHIYPVEPETGNETVAIVGTHTVGVYARHSEGGSTTFLGFRPRDDQSASLGYESRTWYEILKTLGAYPPSTGALPFNDNPTVASRESPFLVCRFPNGTTTVALHFRHTVESWPGGFQRNPQEDAALLARNPLPPDRLELNEFHVNGHTVSYQGRLLVAFRPGPNRGLAAFGGYHCTGIRLNGTEHRFAERPFSFIGWAPVAENRRVPGGAALELWVHGDGEVRIPLPAEVAGTRLFFAGNRPGAVGAEVPMALRDGHAVFTAQSGWPVKHLFLLP